MKLKSRGINKGIAAADYLNSHPADFVMAIGDDWTDEYLFKELPENTYTIKVGAGNSAAKYYINNYKEVRELLSNLN